MKQSSKSEAGRWLLQAESAIEYATKIIKQAEEFVR